jgi:hypothetical protein
MARLSRIMIERGEHDMQAIITKYLSATNHRGARVKASAQAGSLTVGWDDGLDVEGEESK